MANSDYTSSGSQRTVYHRGASDGLIMGAYLAAMYLLQVMGLGRPFVALMGEVFMLGAPVVAYFLMRRGFYETNPRPLYSAIWMHGIMIFLCGSLIMALVAYIYMRFVNPTYIADMVHAMAEFYYELGTPTGEHFGHTLDRMIEARLLPTPISFAFSLMWLGSFLGAIISMIIAAMLRWSKRTRVDNEPL